LEWDEARPGFVEIDLVGHEGGNSFGYRHRHGLDGKPLGQNQGGDLCHRGDRARPPGPSLPDPRYRLAQASAEVGAATIARW